MWHYSRLMPLSPLALVVVSIGAAALGAVLGWWPLTLWVSHELRTARPSLRSVRVAAAISAGVLWGMLVAVFAPTVIYAVTPLLLVFTACGTVLAIIDILEQRLPNRVLLWTTGALVVLLLAATAALGSWQPLLGALLGAVGMFVLYLVVGLVAPKSFGMGDVKLAVPVGLVLGWFGLDAWLIGLVLGAVIGGVFAVIALARRGFKGRGMIPYGPAMLAGAVVAVVVVGVLAG